MAAVDCYAPPAAQVVGPAGGDADSFTCNACNEAFSSAADQRAHCKSERHVYNTKRRLAGLKAISQEAWERKLKESRQAAGGQSKGTSHLKAGKVPRSKTNSEAEPSAEAPVRPEAEVEAVFSPRQSLFDRRHFEDVEENLKYMAKSFDFTVPDREYCTNTPGLLEAIWNKINKPPHACLFCNRKFADGQSVRLHMLDKRHCRIGSLARTRRGAPDQAGSRELEGELEDFYDFHSSTREVTERVTDPKEKAACLVRFFDADRDGFLDHRELSALWAAAHKASQGTSSSSSSSAAPTEEAAEKQEDEQAPPPLPEAMYKGACKQAGADPEEGLDAEALSRLYSAGLADVDAHFSMLQDALTRRLLDRSKARREQQQETIEEDSDEDGDGDDEESGSDEEEEEESDGADTDVLECDDEEEFEEVMRILGLQRVTVLETGDLRLPSGRLAVHRDVVHIWKQRTGHFSQLVANSGNKPKVRPMLALSNSATSAAPMTEREAARVNKKVIAVIHRQACWNLKMGMKKNKMQRKALKIRTGVGDASGGR